MKMRPILIVIVLALLVTGIAAQATTTLYTPTAGDASYAWNSKYGPYGYGADSTTMGVGLYMGAPYGNDYTVSIFEIPLAALAGQTLTGATLVVDSLGFGTGYYYGSARIGWLNTGTMALSGDVVADGLGPASGGMPGDFIIYDSGVADTPGLKSFDVLSLVQADMAAGRAYSTFVMSGSRDTYGSIYTAESGSGPRIIASTVPEPATITMLLAGAASLLLRRRRKA